MAATNGIPPRPERLARPAPGAPAAGPKDSLREGLETVVFVVVLVLLLKTFIAEAFVIPTGSMATTLYGYQKDVTCPQCGYEFPVNCSSEGEVQAGGRQEVVGCICPNCRLHIEFERNHAPECSSGDRVLVSKFLYDLHLHAPAREDVVVFKQPVKPQENWEPINYIKRLIGKPGETIAIYYGDLYVYTPADHPEAERLTYADQPQPERPQDAGDPRYMYQNNDDALRLFREGKFHIVRKTPDKVLILRRLVYDNDHPAQDLLKADLPPRWAPEAAAAGAGNAPEYLRRRQQAEQDKSWTATADNGFQHAGGADLAWLRYRHLPIPRTRPGDLDQLVRTDIKPQLITDVLGYDSGDSGPQHPLPPPPNWVGDLLLEAEVTGAGQGRLVFELSRGMDRFQARWDLANGTCALVHLHAGREETLASQPTRLQGNGTHRVRFANIDRQLIVWVDNSLPFGPGVPYERDADTPQGPQTNDLEPASIAAAGGGVTVRHLQVWRDTYYTRQPGFSDAGPEFGRGDTLSDPDKWDTLQRLPATTMYVQPRHYLCLGDNSPESADSRQWGLVPERLLLGRGLLIYYPFRRAGRIR